MIRINLLPVRETRRAADLRQQGILLGIVAAVAVALSGTFHVYKVRAVSSKQAEIVKVQRELKGLEGVRKSVAQFTEERQEIERKLSVIGSLEAARSGPVRILDEIATRLPKRMWLNSLSMKTGELQLEGMSLDAEIVAAFMTRLAESPIIENVELEETKLEEKEGLKLNTFKVRSAYQYGPRAMPEQTTDG